MKNLTRWWLAGAAACLMLVPGRAEAQILTGEYFGGSSFQTGFDVTLTHNGSGLFTLTIANVGTYGEVFKAIGLANVPSGVTVNYAGSSAPGDWTFMTENSLSGAGIEGVVWAWYAPKPQPQEGLAAGDGFLTFHFQLENYEGLDLSGIGVAVHAISGPNGCSTKFGVWDGGSSTNDVGWDGYDSSCVTVPEPGTNALLALGILGMGIFATRRRSLAELLGNA